VHRRRSARTVDVGRQRDVLWANTELARKPGGAATGPGHAEIPRITQDGPNMPDDLISPVR
jgi:hypothetical protein